jgi:DNA-binding transcriptional ArsR family regulator
MASQLKQFEDLARVFHTLSSPSRLRILTVLSKGRDMTGAAIAKELDIPKPSVSQHLTRLCVGGLLVRRRDRQRVLYSIADLSKHHLGRNAKTTKPGSNAARFGPMELAYPEK